MPTSHPQITPITQKKIKSPLESALFFTYKKSAESVDGTFCQSSYCFSSFSAAEFMQ